jgi:hypothetical protein
MFLTPHRGTFEADGVQESCSTSSSTIFSTNLGRKGLGMTDFTTAWILAIYWKFWQENCLAYVGLAVNSFHKCFVSHDFDFQFFDEKVEEFW